MKCIRKLTKLFAAGIAALVLAFSTRANSPDFDDAIRHGRQAGAWDVIHGFAPILAGIAVAMLDLFVRFA